MNKKLLICLIIVSISFLGACGGNTETQEPDTNVEDNKENNEGQANENTQEKTASVVLIDEAGVKITYTGLKVTEDGIMGKEANVNFEIENNTDKLITVQQRNMSVDGYMVDETILSFSEDVAAGKKAKGSISFSDFEGYDFPEFKENMEFVLLVVDGESWDTIVEKPVTITIE